MMLPVKIKFDKPFFDDIEPQPKDITELTLYLLLDATGKRCNLGKYSQDEVMSCARQLIEKGFIRGTVRGYCDCVWSRLTSKGHFLLKLIQSDVS
jgi:hypothetical protein